MPLNLQEYLLFQHISLLIQHIVQSKLHVKSCNAHAISARKLKKPSYGSLTGLFLSVYTHDIIFTYNCYNYTTLPDIPYDIA